MYTTDSHDSFSRNDVTSWCAPMAVTSNEYCHRLQIVGVRFRDTRIIIILTILVYLHVSHHNIVNIRNINNDTFLVDVWKSQASEYLRRKCWQYTKHFRKEPALQWWFINKLNTINTYKRAHSFAIMSTWNCVLHHNDNSFAPYFLSPKNNYIIMNDIN